MREDALLTRPCGGRFSNLVEAIGYTPLVELPRLSPKPTVRVYAKLEGRNPTGSVKDRIARAMIEDVEERDEVAAFVAGLGTGGTLMGVGRRLKEEDPDTLVVAAEPMQGEDVQGLRSLDDGFIPPILDVSLLDRKIMVANREAIVWTQRLLHEEGVFAGVSAGAIASVAVRIGEELDGGNVVFLIPDDGWKYLSSGVYTTPVEELEGIDSTFWW